MRFGVMGLAAAALCVASPAFAATCGYEVEDAAARMAACEKVLAAPGVDDATAAEARLVLAETYMDADKLPAALAQAEAAVKLAPKSGTGKAARSSLPLPFSGSWSSTCQWAGTM